MGIVFAEVIKFADKQLIRNHRDNFIFAAFFNADQPVVFIADDSIIAFYAGADIAVAAIPADLDIIQCGGFAVDLFDVFDFGTAGEAAAVFGFDFGQHFDGVVDQVREFMADLFDLLIDFPQLQLVFLNIKSGDPANRQSQKFIYILIGDIPQQQMAEWLQAGVNLLILLFLTAALFYFFVDTVLKEKLSESFGVAQLILFIKVKFQLLFEITDKFFHIAAQYLTYAHLNRFAVTDHHDP